MTRFLLLLDRLRLLLAVDICLAWKYIKRFLLLILETYSEAGLMPCDSIAIVNSILVTLTVDASCHSHR